MAGTVNNSQSSSVRTDFALSDVSLDNSVAMGLQGDDLANVLLALNHKDAQNVGAMLAQNGQLAQIVAGTQEVQKSAIGTLNKGGKWILIAVVGVCGFFLLRFLIKKRK